MRKPEVLYWYWIITGGLVGVGFLGLLTGAGALFLIGGLGMAGIGLLFCRVPRL